TEPSGGSCLPMKSSFNRNFAGCKQFLGCPLLAQSGHPWLHRTCPFLTQSGHRSIPAQPPPERCCKLLPLRVQASGATDNEAARFHHCCRLGSRLPVNGARAARTASWSVDRTCSRRSRGAGADKSVPAATTRTRLD